jgi:murein DD-endopeptidase MepM/ murein hydrolase activator NlpD
LYILEKAPMKNKYLFYNILVVLAVCSCSTSQPGLFGNKRSAHEKYVDGLSQAGLDRTQLGSNWINAAAVSLQQPQPVVLPYKETGYFAVEKPAAYAYIFTAKKGEKITALLTTNPAAGYLLFAELWQKDNSNRLLTSMDTLKKTVVYTIENDGQYIIRIQPELLRTVEYTITITVNGSLAFPVRRSGDPKMISFWGAGRDGGTRNHEGIDIAAKFRTPALAAADGYITRVNENNLGGKVVFLNPDNTGYSLYYAHLDSQSVHAGQRVKEGDVVGLVGKTGNAQHTVPHLHFGIYTNAGAIDPLAFIDNRKTVALPVKGNIDKLNDWARLQPGTNAYETPSTKSSVIFKGGPATVVQLISTADNWYKVVSPDGKTAFVNIKGIADKPLLQRKITVATKLLDAPLLTAPGKYLLTQGSTVEVLGTFADFSLVRYNSMWGWIVKS